MLKKLESAHVRLTELGLWLAMASLVSIAGMTFVATMSRYFLMAPIGWTPDWTGYLLCFSIFFAAPAVTHRGQHVSMDLLSTVVTGPIASRLLMGVASFCTFLILLVMAVVVWNSLATAFVRGTGTAAGYPIPRWWLLAAVFYGFSSSSLHVLWMLLRVFENGVSPSSTSQSRKEEA